MKPNLSADFTLPEWLPDVVRLYLDHTGEGIPIRELARREGTHASTVMRQVRRCEMRRDDPLVDEALQTLGENLGAPQGKDKAMNMILRTKNIQIDDSMLYAEACRVLRRMAEPGAILAIAGDMEKAVVTRQLADGSTTRSCVVGRGVAQAFALKDWISCTKQGRVTTYEITPTGRAALKRLLIKNKESSGLAEASIPFIGPNNRSQRTRYTTNDSPIAVLGRRRDKDGKLFLEPDLVLVAERLREDFEIAQMGPRATQNWERCLTSSGSSRPEVVSGGPSHARERVAAALRDLGPGLGDVVLQVCCYLEGLETTEQRMGWAARSGKIVLRIALQRLKRHYDESRHAVADMVG